MTIEELWSLKHKYKLWFEIECLVMEAMFGNDVADYMRKMVTIDEAKIVQIEEVVRHDFLAFLESILIQLGGWEYGRYIHYGLTSSDVVDTALCYVMKESASYLKSLSPECVHGLWDDCIKVISVGKIRGAVGTFSNVNPRVETYVCCRLGLEPVDVCTQVIPRDRHAWYMFNLLRIGHILGCEDTSILYANAMVAMENINLWHERDISHSSTERIIISQSLSILEAILRGGES